MSQNISVHSTDDSGTNIIPGIDDGGAGVGNGSTYQIYRNDAPTGDSGRVYYSKDKDGNTETIAGGGGNSPTGVILIASKIGANMNTIADQTIPIVASGSLFIPTDFVITNASTSLTTADDAEIWTGASYSGDQIGGTLTGAVQYLTSASDFISRASQHLNGANMQGGTEIFNKAFTNSLFLILGTPQGAPATADIYIYGYKIQ